MALFNELKLFDDELDTITALVEEEVAWLQETDALEEAVNYMKKLYDICLNAREKVSDKRSTW